MNNPLRLVERTDWGSGLIKVVMVVVIGVTVGGDMAWCDEVKRKRPNILWITAEDMSPTMGCYGDAYAVTPNTDQLARKGIRYRHAFATSPVCSPSRSCLINGVMATGLGTHPMRSSYPLPEFMKGFPALLRNAGYFTSNNVKTDYNSGSENAIIEASWDRNGSEADWRQRGSGQPFFSVINLMTSHQSRSMVWPEEQFQEEVQKYLSGHERHDPTKAPVPPYYPDTPVIRKTIARYYDCVTRMDQQVGEILSKLKDDGLAGSTIVFFYSDHGSGMPRHKRIPLDSGMRVPLIIHIPDEWSQYRPVPHGEITDRLVSFEDFGPTVLSLAGVQVPGTMSGKAFLGEQEKAARRYVFGHRDRIDEAIDLSRTVRDHRYLYVRNYMPHLGWNQPSAWPDQGQINHEFYKLAGDTSGLSLSPAQRHFTDSQKAPEELYDCVSDPMNLFNLAKSPVHQEILQRMRKAHIGYVNESQDLGFIPELELAEIHKQKPGWQWARETRYKPEMHRRAAALSGNPETDQVRSALTDADAVVRYWGALAVSSMNSLDDETAKILLNALDDGSLSVAMESARALTAHNHDGKEKALETLARLLKHEDVLVVLHAARTIEMLGERAAPLVPAIRRTAAKYEEAPGDLAWFVRFSTSGFLSRYGRSE